MTQGSVEVLVNMMSVFRKCSAQWGKADTWGNNSDNVSIGWKCTHHTLAGGWDIFMEEKTCWVGKLTLDPNLIDTIHVDNAYLYRTYLYHGL